MRFPWSTYLIVTATDEETAQDIKQIIKEFLNQRGLELSEEKTIITNIDDGFDFLGWNIRKYNNKLLIKPSKKSIDRVNKKLKQVVKKSKAVSQDILISKLNPIITGWSNYHQISVSSEIFSKIDDSLFHKLWSWALRRHGKKGKFWVKNKYWKIGGTRKWVFKDNLKLKVMSDKKIIRHISIKLSMNPYLDEEYFEQRKFKQGVKKLTGRFKNIWQKQEGKCAICKQAMNIAEERDVRHIIQPKDGGTEKLENLIYVHSHCY